MASPPNLAARALANADHARQRRESERERNRRECPAMTAFVDEWHAQFGLVAGVLTEGERTVRWGVIEHGRAVQASASPKPGKLLREKK